MNLNRRFFILNTLTVLITMLVTFLAVVVFIAVYGNIFGSDAVASDFKRTFELRTGFAEIKTRVLTSGIKELEGGYQQTLSSGMNILNADAIVVRNGDLVYSTRKIDKLELEKYLTFSSSNLDDRTFELDGKTYVFDRTDFTMKNGNRGVLLMFAWVNETSGFYKYLIILAVCFFVLSFVGMNSWVSYSLSKRVINPVIRLKNAASKISSGDLNCEIIEESDGEIRELCTTLEEMRIKLKESVYLQAKYDDNRRFLISSISHDLKTPVTSIKGYIEGILDGIARTPEKIQEYLETARSKAILVNSMIDDLLLYSKLDMNQIPFNLEKVELVSYFEYCIGDYKHEFEKANIQLEMQNDITKETFAVIDRERLKRVIQNILDNSIKYMSRPDGVVKVILRETRTSAIVEIRDNGKGIPEENLPYIFDRFYRVDTSRRSAEGSGLGLAIAKQIVEGHEGKIWAVSNEGTGTSIIISLKKE